MDLFGMGSGEILLVLIVALIILGPARVVEFAGTLGRMARNLRKISSDMTTAISREINTEGARKHLPPGDSDGDKPASSPDVTSPSPAAPKRPRPKQDER